MSLRGPVVGARLVVVCLSISVALHALVFGLAAGHLFSSAPKRDLPADAQRVIQLELLPPPPDIAKPVPKPAARAPARSAVARPPQPVAGVRPVTAAAASPATMAAPPAPTAEEWGFAGRYTLKNSKAYRYTWGQQIRSMMGTAVAGPDQGMVRFRVEIAPDGRLARLETLWSTSAEAERRARQAIGDMPRWPPPTPTGRPLVFEKTLSFTPFANDGPPLYRHDCEPDRPAFRNPFAWDGSSDREPAQAQPSEPLSPEALADCLKQLPKDSIDAERARDQRVMDRWGWSASEPGR